MKKIFIIILIIFSFLKSQLSAASAMNFLNLAPNARVSSLGESFIALSDDVSSVLNNPAGLVNLNETEIAFNALLLVESINYFNLQSGKKFSFGSLGLNFSFLSYGEIEKYFQGEKIGSITPSDYLIQLAYAREIKNKFSAGLSFKFANENLTEDYKSSAFAFDIGFLYRGFLKNLIKRNWSEFLNFALGIYNLGIGPKFSSKSESLPLNFKFGFAYKYRLQYPLAYLRDLNFLLDFYIPTEGNFGLRYGTELWWYDIGKSPVDIALRFGLKFPSDLGILSMFTTGIGFRVYNNLELDYAFLNYGDLGITHRIGAIYKFGKIEKPKFVEKPKEEEIIEELEEEPIKKEPKKEIKKEEKKEELEEEFEEEEEEEFEEE